MEEFACVSNGERAGEGHVRTRTCLGRLAAVAVCVVVVAGQVRTQETSSPVRPELEAQIARLKTETAVQVAAARPRLEAMSAAQRLAAPPVI